MTLSGWLRLRRHLVSAVVVLMGAGSLSLAVATAGQATGFVQAAPTTTRLAGFSTTGATVRVGGAVQDAVTVLPRAARSVTVQFRRAGTSAFTNASTGRSTRRGAMTLVLRPPAQGRWQFRAVVAATKRAKKYTSPVRTVVAAGRIATTAITGFSTAAVTVKPGDTVTDDVAITPAAARLVLVQARRPGTAGFVTQSTGASGRNGSFRAVYRPTTAGVWGFRLVVPPNANAGAATSQVRIITADDNPGRDTTAPRPVTGLTGSGITNRAITLSWTNPTDVDYTGAVIRRAVGATAPATPTAGSSVSDVSVPGKTFTDGSLSASTQYSYAVFAHDGRPNYAVAVTITLRTAANPDATIPSPVRNLRATTTGRTAVTLAWTNPTDVDFTGVVIRRATGGTAPGTPTAGTAIADVTSPGTTVTDSGLVPGTRYSYAAFAHDATPNFSTATNLTVTTLPPATQAVLAIRQFGNTEIPSVTRLTVNAEYKFDGAGTLAADGTTIVSGSLDYGDGSPVVNFAGPPGPIDFYNTVHTYTTNGPKTVAFTVTDSDGTVDRSSTLVNVFDAPTAATISTPAGAKTVGTPVILTLGTQNAAGTTFKSYEIIVSPNAPHPLPPQEESLFIRGTGTPPATKGITFTQPGTYEIQFTFLNDAGGVSPISRIPLIVN